MLLLALGFGSGCARIAPGTWGTLVAVVPCWLALQQLSLGGYLLLTFVLIVVGVWLCGQAAQRLQVHDHPGIVWDEIAGYFVTMIAAPDGWVWAVVGFALFRLFDITKPWPIRRIDRGVDGGVGIMADDLLAGVYAWLVLQGLALAPAYLDAGGAA